MKSSSLHTRKVSMTLVTLGAFVLMAYTPMAALAHTLAAHGGGSNNKCCSGVAGALTALFGSNC